MDKNILKNIIEESTKKVLKEYFDNNILSMDISKFDINFLKRIYIDFRKVAYPMAFGDKFSFSLKEVYGDILEPDEVVRMIKNRFHLVDECFRKVEMYNRISIYVLYATIGINDELIAESMKKLGYYAGAIGEEQTVYGMSFRIVQFEPMCYLQNDETNNVKSTYKTLFHWTLSSNLESIMKNGLIPSHKNPAFNYPPRIYLIKGDATEQQIIWLGSMLCDVKVNDNDADTRYTLLEIDLSKIDDNIRFYFDPNAEVGIYTEDEISPKAITPVLEKDFLEQYRK